MDIVGIWPLNHKPYRQYHWISQVKRGHSSAKTKTTRPIRALGIIMIFKILVHKREPTCTFTLVEGSAWSRVWHTDLFWWTSVVSTCPKEGLDKNVNLTFTNFQTKDDFNEHKNLFIYFLSVILYIFVLNGIAGDSQFCFPG